MNSETNLLLEAIDQAYDHRSWHGTNLRGSIRGLTAREAAWRPGKNRHNIWEIVVHCAYWKYAVRRRLRGDRRGSFPLKGSNWFAVPEPLTDATWRGYVRLLDEQHQALVEAVEQFSAAKLDRPSKGSRQPPRRLIQGIALHDVYHAGQIRGIKGAHRHGS